MATKQERREQEEHVLCILKIKKTEAKGVFFTIENGSNQKHRSKWVDCCVTHMHFTVQKYSTWLGKTP